MLSSAKSIPKDLGIERETFQYLVKLVEKLMGNLPKRVEEGEYRGLFITGEHHTFILTKNGIRRGWYPVKEEDFVKNFLYNNGHKTPLELARYLLGKLNKIVDLYKIELCEPYLEQTPSKQLKS